MPMTTTFLDKVDAFGRVSRLRLTNIFDGIPGRKNLVIEPSLMKPLDRFIGASVLRDHGVDKIYKLDKTGGQDCSFTTIYMFRADLLASKIVCNQINSALGHCPEVRFHIIVVPKLLATIELLFEEEGLIEKVAFHAFAWDLIQLDNKILSYEMPKLFRQLFIEKDQCLLTSIAKSLWSVYHVLGKPNLNIFHGKFACLVSHILDTWIEENGPPERPDSDVGCTVIMDRDVDYASVFLTPGTYTGLLSEVMNVSTGTVELRQINKDKKELSVSMHLTSKDEIYNQIKNQHFAHVNVYLKKKANELINEKNRGTSLSLGEMKSFVEGQLGKLKSDSVTLSNHVNICERICNEMGQKFETIQTCQTSILYGEDRREIVTEIEDLMNVSNEMYLPLRLMCLLSLMQNGITEEERNSLTKQFLHSYGHQHLPMLHNLEKCGLLSVAQNPEEISARIASKVAQVVPFPKRTAFQVATQKLKLLRDVPKNYCLKNPQDAGYVFGGAYIPLVAQLVSCLIKKEMSPGEVIKCLPGGNTRVTGTQSEEASDTTPRCLLVYVIGGITYAEIAALQFLEAKTGCRILCCGTSVTTAKSLLSSAM